MSVLVGYEATPSTGDTCNTTGVTNITPTQGLIAPTGLALDPAGDLFIADSGHNCVRELLANTTGSKSLQTVVDTCNNYPPVGLSTNSVSPSPTALLIDYEGDIVVSIADSTDDINQVIFHGIGNPATEVCDIVGQTSAAVVNPCPFFNGTGYRINSPGAIAIDQGLNYYLADTGDSCVRELSSTLVVSTPIGVCTNDGSGTTPIANFAPVGLAVGNQGYLYISNANQATVLQYTGGGVAPTVDAGIPDAQSTVYTGAQEGIAAVDVSLNNPTGLAVDPSGNIDVADSGNGIVRQLAYNSQFGSEGLKNASAPQTLWFEINSAVNLTATPGTDFQISNGNNTCTGSLTPSATTTPTTCEVSLDFDPTYPGLLRSPITLTDSIAPQAYAFGLSGIGEGANALFVPGTINTPFGGLNTPSATVVDTAGDIFYAETAGGSGDIKVVRGGNTTTLVPAGGMIQTPVGLALDSAQNLYVADSTANTVFKVDANGNVTTPPGASGLSDPVAVAVDTEGNLFVAQDGSGATDVVEIYAGGQEVVIAGLGTNTAPNSVPASQAEFVKPSGLYLDANNVLYVSDEGAYRVYDIDTTGTIHFFAGNGTQTTSNPLVPTGVGLQGPSGLTGDAGGDIYIADGPANLIYVVFGGSDQNPGIESLVGTGAAVNVALNDPISVALDGADDLYLVDSGSNSIREVTYQNPTLNFGNVKPGTASASMMTTLWDSGNQPLSSLTTFPPLDSVDFTQVSDGCGGTLAQGSTCNLVFEFTPAAYGSYQTTAGSNSSAVDTPQVITLIGNSPQPTLSVPAVTATYGQAYTLTATITSTTTPPTGTISFAITLPAGYAQPLCTNVPVAANGTATCSPAPTLLNVIAGGYTFSAAYSGDVNYLPLTETAALTINPIPVTIAANNASRPYDTANPAFTSTVTPGDPIPAGQSIPQPTSYTTTAVLLSPPSPPTYPIVPTPLTQADLPAGTLLTNYAITYVNGALTIGPFTTSVTITPSSPLVTSVFGTAYTLTATVTSGQTPAPTGTLSFTIGTGPTAQTLCANVPLSGGSASCSPSPILVNVGTYTVTLSYSGDSYYAAATSSMGLSITPRFITITCNYTRPYGTPNPSPFIGTYSNLPAGQSFTDTFSTSAGTLTPPGMYPIYVGNPATPGPGTLASNYLIIYIDGTLTITPTSTGLTVSSPPVSAVYGQPPPYVLTATVTSTIAPAPTGTVTFAIASGPGAGTLCANVTLTSGTATCSVSPTLLDVLYNGGNVTPYTVTVTYSGDTNYQSEASSLALTITPIPVTITANPATRPYGQPNQAFTGTISTQPYIIPTGQSVTATYATVQTIASLPGVYTGANGIVPTTVFGAGTVPGDYAVTLMDGTLTITQVSTGPTITAPAVTAYYGTAYTLAASVTSTTTPAPTGTVTFAIGAQTLCANVALTGGHATCSPSPTLLNVLYAGGNVTPYTVTVSYSGDTIYPADASTLALTITPAPVTITANPASRPFGQPNPTFTGNITSTYPIPTGQSITATYNTTATVATPPGVYTGASGIVPTAVAGANTLLANYAITLADGTLTITELKTSTFSTPAVTAFYGTVYQLAASLTGSQSPAPTGTVTFTIGGQPVCPAATLSAGGAASCAPSPTLENAGTYTVTATYSGDTNYAGATSTFTLTITPAPVTITATSFTRAVDTPNPTLTGNVSPQNPFPAGQSITATFNTTAQENSPPGTYPITPTAVAGTGTLLSNYAITLVKGVLTVVQTMPTGSFSVSATPPEQEIDIEGTVQFPITLTSLQDFTDNVSFTCSGLPEGVTCSFAPGTVKPDANGTSSSVMTLTGSADNTNVPPGSFGFLRTMPGAPGTPPSAIVWAWTMLPIGFSGSAAGILLGRRRRSPRSKGWTRFTLWLIPLFLLLASLSGCGAPNNFKIYTVTITGTDSTYAVPVSKSTTVQLVLAR
jgi:sugar lactone lactonase YvrE